MEKNLKNFFKERGFRCSSTGAKTDRKDMDTSENSSLPSVDKNIRDFKKAYQQLKLDLVKLYMDVKIRNKEEIAEYNDETFKAECVELYDLDYQIVISYIKQSIEILLMMKDDEYGELISSQK